MLMAGQKSNFSFLRLTKTSVNVGFLTILNLTNLNRKINIKK